MLRAMVVIILLGLLGAVVKDPPQSVTQQILPLHSSIDLNGPEPELRILPTDRGEP